MRSDIRPWFWAASVFVITAGGGLLFYASLIYVLNPESAGALSRFRQDHFPLLLLLFVVPAVFAGGIAAMLLNRYVRPVERLSDLSSLIGQQTDLPHHTKTGVAFIDRLGHNLEEAAERLSENETAMQEQLRTASRKLARERDTLATIIQQVQQGLIVTNKEGHILLFNGPAGRMLSFPDHSPPVYLGLGRPLEQIIEPGLARFAITECRNGHTTGPLRFVVRSADDKLLSVKALPASLSNNPEAGAVFFLEDITRSFSRQNLNEEFADQGLRKVRDAVAGIRAAADNLKTYPDAGKEMQDRFLELILGETETIAELVGAYQKEQGENQPADAALLAVSVRDVFDLAGRIAKAADVPIQTELVSGEWTIEADRFSTALSLVFLASRIRPFALSGVTLKSGLIDGHYRLQLCWDGDDPGSDTISGWLDEHPEAGAMRLPYSLQTLVQQHRAEWWTKEEGTSHSFNLILPKSARATADISIRPGHYDFGLFSRTPEPEIAARPLKKITATVFDTETTGLYPSDGDRLLSVGAVRIVNGKIQEDQTFHQYMNPGRPVPEASSNIHGITTEMVANKPGAKECLADFHRFCGDDIFIAHNAAFDMRFLELEQRAAGIDFKRPVLDTLLLSTILHPNLEGHSIDALAARYGIRTETRHQALGDALMTARLFVRMIPLLAGIQIHTIGDAQTAGRDSLYARMKY